MAYGHLPTGIRVLSPAIVGALMQLIAVVLITAAFYPLARVRYFPLGWPLSICAERTSCESASLLLRLSYLLTAIGVALTNNRFISQAVEWLATHLGRRAMENPNRQQRPSQPNYRLSLSLL